MAIGRHFIGWDEPALPQVAQYLIGRCASVDELDLSGVILVFPARRAARRMLELLVELASDRYPDFVPPRMVTVGQLPELLYPQQKKLADELTRLLVWRRAVSLVPAHELRPALTRLPPDDALSSWIRLCGSLKNQHDELAGEGLDFADVVDTLYQGRSTEETARWEALRRIQSEYHMQMDDLNLWDRQTSRLIAVEQQECMIDRDIILIGAVDLNGISRRMLDQVAERVTAIICAPESVADGFDEWGCLIPPYWQDRTLRIPDEATVIADDPPDQASAVVRFVAELDGQRRADEVAIAVADDALVPVILQALEQSGASGRWPVGAALNASRPWRLLDAIARHLATAQSGQLPDFATLSDLIRHVDVTAFVEHELEAGGLVSTSSWLADFDDYEASHLQTVPDRMLGPRSRAEVVDVICRSVERLLSCLCHAEEQTGNDAPVRRRGRRAAAPGQQFLFGDPQQQSSVHARLQRRRPLHDWAVGAMRLLSLVYERYETGVDAVRDESMIACLTAFNDLIESLSAIPASVLPRCTAAQAIPMLLMQLADLTTVPEENPQAIDLMGWLELPLDDSPVVTVCGFNEGRIPQSVTSDVFLPNSIRTRLGLNDNSRRYARDAWALESLLRNRDEVRLIAGRRDSQGDPLTPSRLWFAGDADTTTARILQFYAEEETPQAMAARETADSSLHDSADPAHTSGFIVPLPEHVPPVPDHIPVTHFRDYLDCPYRYLLRRELGISSVVNVPREMDARLFGNLIHAVLNRFGESGLVQSTSSESIASALHSYLRQEADRNFGQQLSATVAVQLQMAEERLRAFADWQADQTADGWIIRHAECDLKTPFTDSRGRPITINGRVDRIDQHQATGQWRVLDYKTGEKANRPKDTHRRQGEWVDLQLPLYRILVRELEIPADVQLGYINLPGDLSQLGESLADWDADELADADDTARQVAADILDLRIDQVTSVRGRMPDELTRICQDTVVNRQIPWLTTWKGRAGSGS